MHGDYTARRSFLQETADAEPHPRFFSYHYHHHHQQQQQQQQQAHTRKQHLPWDYIAIRSDVISALQRVPADFLLTDGLEKIKSIGTPAPIILASLHGPSHFHARTSKRAPHFSNNAHGLRLIPGFPVYSTYFIPYMSYSLNSLKGVI